jgi:large subunit ribosomal protein L25
MAQVELNVEIRDKSGKGVARKLRAAGKLPAVVYGKDIEPKAITVDPNELNNVVSGEAGWNALISLKGIPELSKEVVILKDASFHAIRRNFTSADFHIMNLKEKTSFMVPVNIVGTSTGQKMGGSLELIRKEL